MQQYKLRSQQASFGEELILFAKHNTLECTETSLRSLPTNSHWHLRNPRAKGTLEITWIHDTGEAWINVHANRMGDWIPGIISELLRQFG